MAECDRCGAHVSRRFFRVFASNDGELLGCPMCMSSTDLRDGETVR